MKKFLLICVIVWILTGCSAQKSAMDEALTIRQRFSDAQGCEFTAKICADYGNEIYEFIMQCQTDETGDLTFRVVQPESIASVSGTVTGNKANLTFDDKVLAFPVLADGQITPAVMPWVFVHTLTGGYLSSCSSDSDGLHLLIDDRYEDGALRLEIHFGNDKIPSACEIMWEGRRVGILQITDFRFL